MTLRCIAACDPSLPGASTAHPPENLLFEEKARFGSEGSHDIVEARELAPTANVLDKVPDLKPSDLDAFGLWSKGVLFAIDLELGGGHRVTPCLVTPCLVPHEDLGTSLTTLLALAKNG